MAVQHLSGEEAKKHLDKEKIVLSIGADWCGPCRMMMTQLEELSKEVQVIKVDVDKNKEFAKEMGVTGIPATFVYHKGQIKQSFNGFVAKEEIEKFL